MLMWILGSGTTVCHQCMALQVGVLVSTGGALDVKDVVSPCGILCFLQAKAFRFFWNFLEIESVDSIDSIDSHHLSSCCGQAAKNSTTMWRTDTVASRRVLLQRARMEEYVPRGPR